MKLRRNRFLLHGCVLAFMCAVSISILAQTEDPDERLQKVKDMYSLDAAHDKPWHMKMDVIVFSDYGQNPQQGTIEVWNAGNNQRTNFDFGVAKFTTLSLDGKKYFSRNDKNVPYRAMELLDRELFPGPSSGDLQHDFASLQKHIFGKLKMDCIMLTPTVQLKDAPLGLFPTYCLQQGSDVLLASYDVGDEVAICEQQGSFQGHKVLMKLEIAANKVVVASSNVTSLTTYEPQSEDFKPTADMKDGDQIVKLPAKVVAGRRLTFVPPTYPDSAKRNHLSGTVLLQAVIDQEGHIRSLRPVNIADQGFIMAAVAAVRHWTFEPYVRYGHATDVSTTIQVNFRINP